MANAYLSGMIHRALIALLASVGAVAITPACAQPSNNDRYTIMQPELPEPWLPPKYKSPRGTPQHVVPVKPLPPPHPKAPQPPPPIYVPQTGQVLPNLPTVSPSGPGGRETYQDRAARCAHQAGTYGALEGDRNTYIGSCINQ